MLEFSRAAIRSFAGSHKGTIAPLFALSLIAISGAVGLAVDSARGYGLKTHMQNSLDAAVLATAKRVAQDPGADITAIFTQFFNASRPASYGATISSISVAKVGNAIQANVRADLPTTFMQILGQTSMSVPGSSTAEFGIGEVELVLALDNTASMAGVKIDTLKSAALRLVDTMSRNAVTPDKLRVGVVPFAKYVNVGMSYRNASWMNVPADWNETVNSCGNTYPNATYTNCRTVSGPCTLDGIPSTCSWQQCDENLGTPVYQCSTNVVQHRWNGCVFSRPNPLNVQDGSYGTRIPGKMDETCSTPVTPLTTDRQTIRDAINAMAPDGDTYIPEGVMWGWRLLSPQAPFDESRSGTAQVSRYMVLMTDGVNSVSPSVDGHDGTDTAAANAITTQACANAKADGITVFTVAFEVTDNTVKDILRTCATSGGFFYDATDTSALMTAFDAIGQQLVNLRIKQ